MTLGQGFQLHPGAADDIAEIWLFIAQDNLRAAVRFREDILGTIRSLTAFPHQGYKRPDLTGRPLRFQPIREYLIAYAPDEKPLLMVAVIHGRRNPRVLAVLRSRE